MVVAALLVWVGGTALGLWLIDLDAGPTLLPITDVTGVTAIDAAGALALAAAWVLPALLLRRRPAVRARARRHGTGAVAIAALALVLLAAMVVVDFPGRKFALAGAVVLVQASGFVALVRA